MPSRDYLGEGASRSSSLSTEKRVLATVLFLALGILCLWGVWRGGFGNGLLPDPTKTQVTMVFDGDTLAVEHLRDHQKIRLYCIDAPEGDQPPWGHLSRDQLRDALPPGTPVLLEVRAKDVYGRFVAEVFTESRNLNLFQVETGMAAVYSRFCQEDAYFEAEVRAKKEGRGIWASPGLHQTPWKWRHSPRTPSMNSETP